MWTRCDGSGLRADPMPDWQAACPVCLWTFSTFITDAITPEHWLGVGDEWVRVGGPRGRPVVETPPL